MQILDYLKARAKEERPEVDPADLGRTYTEGELMPPEERPDTSEDEEALTRYANELTGQNDTDLISAAETLITDRIKEDSK